jgi:hypothetical protein
MAPTRRPEMSVNFSQLTPRDTPEAPYSSTARVSVLGTRRSARHDGNTNWLFLIGGEQQLNSNRKRNSLKSEVVFS